MNDLGEGKHAVGKISAAAVGICGGAEPEGDFSPESIASDREGTCDIRVLALGTETGMVAMVGNFNKLVADAIAKMNLILKKSSVLNTKLVLAAIESTEGYFEEDGLNFDDALTAIRNNPTAIQRRNLNGADITVLFVNEAIMDQNDAPAGIATIGGRWAVVQNNGGDNGLVFAHEVGHLLRASHELCSDPNSSTNCEPDGGNAHAHILTDCDGKQRETVMFGQVRVNSMIDHFSNPNVKIEGNIPTGIAGERDNASVIRDFACTASNHSTLFQDAFNVSISGPSQGCWDEGLAFTAFVIGNGIGNCTYSWTKSIGGVNFGGVISTLNHATLIVPDEPPGTLIVLKLQVTNALGQTIYAFKSIFVVDAPCGGNNWNPLIGSVGNSISAITGMLAFPNPAQDELSVEITASRPVEKPAILIQNQYGRILQRIDIDDLQKGRNIYYLNTGDLTNGLYFFSTLIEGQYVSDKFGVFK